jgi:acyl-CoA synthetase (NDP forming)
VLVARTGADHLAPTASRRLRAAGIPAYPTPGRAVRAAAALHKVSTRRRVDDSATTAALVVPPPSHGAGESEVKTLLQDAGLPVPTGRLVTSAEDARAAVEHVGGRAVLKAVVPGLTHKTEAGGVLLDIDADSAPEAFERLASLGGQVLVEELVPGGVEALVGVAASPLGPVLTLGLGGVLTELVDDVALRLLPVTTQDVEEMLDETRLGTLLQGVRGAAPADRAALVQTVVRLAAVVGSWPAGYSLDLNPVTVLPDGEGVRILDAAYIAPEDT